VLAYLTPIAILWLTHGVMARREVWSNWFQIAALGIGVLSLGERYLRRRPGWEPTRTQKVLALLVGLSILGGAGLTFAAEEQWINSLLVLPAFRLVFTATSLAWLTSPLIFAILIADDPAFDPRRLLARSLPYALLSGILAAMYLALVLVSQRLFAQATGEETLAVTLVAALVVAFTFAPLRQSLQRTIDRIFRRDPEGMRRAFDRAGRELLSALSRDEVRASVETALAHGLPRLRLEWPENGPPLLAEGEEVPEDARPAVQNLLLQAGVRLENLALQDLRAAAERRAIEMREAATRAELRALQAQVQPHFLFNALNALSYLTETDPPAAQRFTERLADMLRYTVEAGTRPAALLSEEIAFVEDYLGVARERYETPLAFEYRVTPELLSAAVPPLLLQPLVENSLKHGCSQDAAELRLSLDAQRDDGWITLRFSDNGIPHANGARGLGVGLSNLEQRMRRFAGEEASVHAESSGGGGFAVTVKWRAPGKVAA
jgi:signal transduction histidine kinase